CRWSWLNRNPIFTRPSGLGFPPASAMLDLRNEKGQELRAFNVTSEHLREYYGTMILDQRILELSRLVLSECRRTPASRLLPAAAR
ncbi:hypothetical protein NQU49_25465, partial [Escherichia coli]|uniref:hypothetical protein n=1 Tax=Escherichia coli TaxID=562 RepID=UPI00211819D0